MKALLLIGSPKPSKSTSGSLGTYLLDRLIGQGVDTQIIHVVSSLRSQEKLERMLLAVDAADVLIFSFPLYADSPPAGVTGLMELIAERRKPKLTPTVTKTLGQIAVFLESGKLALALGLIAGVIKIPALPAVIAGALISALKDRKTHAKAAKTIRDYMKSYEPKQQSLVVICNSGLPEASQNDTAIAICRNFASQTGIRWLGGLALGGGAAIDGKPLDQAGRMVRNVKKSLELAAVDIARGGAISDEAVQLMAKPITPHWLYRLFGKIGWWRQARPYKTIRNLNARPYEPTCE